MKNKVFCLAKKKRGRRMFAKRRGHLAICSYPDCLISAHTTSQEGTKIGAIPCFKGMSCFQIAHSMEANDLFTVIERKNYKYLRAKPKHFICDDLKEQYEREPTILQEPSESPAERRRGRPSKSTHQNDEFSSVSGSDSDSSRAAESVTRPERTAGHRRNTLSRTGRVTQVQRPKKKPRNVVMARTRRSSRLQNRK